MDKINQQQYENNNLTEQFKKEGQEFKEKAQDLKNKATEKVEEGWDEVKAKASDAQETVANYVKENPLKSLGWAALAGAVIAVLIRK